MLRNLTLRAVVFALIVIFACWLHIFENSTVHAQESAAQAATATSNQAGDEKTKPEQTDDNKDDKQAASETNDVVIKAHFLGASEHQVACRPEEWAEDPRVEFCVPHGASVKQGDVLVRLQSRKLENAIQDQQQSVSNARVAAQKAHQELEHFRKSTRMSASDAERAERIATEDLKRFVTVERDQRKEALEFDLKNSQDYLVYQEEELKQLVKMYEADDLTEETEEIVLRRTRDDVERSRNNLIRSRQSLEKGVEVDLPRSQQQLEDALKKAALAREKIVTSASTEIEEKEVNVAKLDRELARAEERLSRLTADQRWMTLKAPISGLVYLGEQRLGVWPDPAPQATSLRPGGTVKPHQVLMTVVEPVVGLVVGTIDEADLPHVTKDRRGKLVVSALPGLESDATVMEISSVPVGEGKFLVTLQPNLPQGSERVVPGMTCEITFEKSK